MPVERIPGDWFKNDEISVVPLTTAQEMARSSQQLVPFRSAGRKEMSFLSYSKNDFRFDRLPLSQVTHSIKQSTYKCDYVPPSMSICKPISERDQELPDWLMNRKQRNYLEAPTDITTKFMDDWIVDSNPIRKKIDYFRQMKTATFQFV